MDHDPDPELRPRATTPVVTFTSGGETLFGVLHVPAGPGPHPVVLVLHGFPGYERNFDLAQALRRAGCASLVFHYRGSWGVGGNWPPNTGWIPAGSLWSGTASVVLPR